MSELEIETVPPSVAIAAYDSASRDYSGRADRPTDRMSVSSVPLISPLEPGTKSRTSYMWWDVIDRTVVLLDHKQRPLDPYDPQAILSALDGDNRLIVDAPSTIQRVLSVLTNTRTYRHMDARRTLMMLVSLPVSSRMPIITRALNHKKWLPSRYETNTYADWVSAFDLRDVAPPQALKTLFKACLQGEKGTRNAKRLDKIAKIESHLLSGVKYSGLSTACSAFNSSEKISDQWSALCAMDVFLRQRGVFDGTVSRGKVLEVYDRSFHCELSLPTKLKVARPMQITAQDGAQIAMVEIESLSIDEGILVADIFVTSAARTAGWLMSADTDFYITSTPFEGLSPSAASRKKWTSPPEPFVPRPIPAHIAALNSKSAR